MRTTYKQVVIDEYEVYDVETDMMDAKTKVLDIDEYDIDIDTYDPEGLFNDWFGSWNFDEGFNHVITVELFKPEDDESVDDPVATWKFKYTAR